MFVYKHAETTEYFKKNSLLKKNILLFFRNTNVRANNSINDWISNAKFSAYFFKTQRTDRGDFKKSVLVYF